jgi:hypothetical protein
MRPATARYNAISAAKYDSDRRISHLFSARFGPLPMGRLCGSDGWLSFNNWEFLAFFAENREEIARLQCFRPASLRNFRSLRHFSEIARSRWF